MLDSNLRRTILSIFGCQEDLEERGEGFAKLNDFQNCHAYHEGILGQKIEAENQEKSDGNKHEVMMKKTVDNDIPTILADEILQPELRVSRI